MGKVGTFYNTEPQEQTVDTEGGKWNTYSFDSLCHINTSYSIEPQEHRVDQGVDSGILTALTASVTRSGVSAHLTALGQENTKFGFIAFPPCKIDTNTLRHVS